MYHILCDPTYYQNGRVSEWGGSAKQAFYALNGAYAFKIYYDESIRVYYEGVTGLPENIDKSKLIEYTANLDL